MSVPITYANLHRLWPRGDGAVRLLMYLWRIVCQGYVPNFTDEQLAKRFFRKPATIRRWRARWEAKGILITRFRCQRTFYEVNAIALQDAIQAAIAEEEEKEMLAKARRLEQKARCFEEIGQKLRSQWAKTHSQGDQNDRLELIKTQGSTTSIPLNQSSVPGKPENGWVPEQVGWASRETQLEDASRLQTEARPNSILSLSEQPLLSKGAINPTDLEQGSMRLWMLKAAKGLVEQNGHEWNRNLQRLLDGLETKAIVRAVSSLWEQIQKGNVRNAPKFLTRAVQRKYCCTKGWNLPDALPSRVLFPQDARPPQCKNSTTLPEWLPIWAKHLLEKLVLQGSNLTRYELVDGGIQVWTDTNVQFFPHYS